MFDTQNVRSTIMYNIYTPVGRVVNGCIKVLYLQDNAALVDGAETAMTIAQQLVSQIIIVHRMVVNVDVRWIPSLFCMYKGELRTCV